MHVFPAWWQKRWQVTVDVEEEQINLKKLIPSNFVAQTQTSDNGPPFHTALRLLYFLRNSDPNAEIYLPNLFQWEEGNPFFLVHWDKKIKLAWKTLYESNSTILEGFIPKAKWGKKPNKTTKT